MYWCALLFRIFELDDQLFTACIHIYLFLIITYYIKVFYFKYCAPNLRQNTQRLRFLAFFTKSPGNASWAPAFRALVFGSSNGHCCAKQQVSLLFLACGGFWETMAKQCGFLLRKQSVKHLGIKSQLELTKD